MKVLLIFFIVIFEILSFQSAFAFTPIVSVTDTDNHVITQGWSTTFNVVCDVYGGYVRMYISDNGQQIATLDEKSTLISNSESAAYGHYQYTANGELGTHNIYFICVDDSGEEGFFNYFLTEYPAAQTQPTYNVVAQSQGQTIQQTNDTFHFDNGLFTLVFIGMVILTFILILALSHGGHFRRRERLEPVRQSTSIFDMYRGNTVSFRPSDIRGSLPRGYDDAEVSVELPPPTKILDSVWNDPEAKKENVRRLANDPMAMMEAKRIEMTNNLERKCPKCSDPLRNQNNEIVHCVFCCKIFHTTEELDTHNCKKAKEAGM